MADRKVLLKGGRVIDPAAGLDEKLDVLLADGVVADPAQTQRLLQRGQEAIEARVGEEDELTGNSSAINTVRATLKKVAATGSRVLITGPAGVVVAEPEDAGVGLAARALLEAHWNRYPTDRPHRLRSALSDRFASERIIVLDGWGLDTPKTKTVRIALETLGDVAQADHEHFVASVAGTADGDLRHARSRDRGLRQAAARASGRRGRQRRDR